MSKHGVSAGTLKRSVVLAIFLVVVFLFLVLRILAIQVLDFSRYQQKVIDQMTTMSPVRAARGEILDCAGRVLATNKTSYRISLFPNVIAQSGDREGNAARIAGGLATLIPGATVESIQSHIMHTTTLERTVARSVDRGVAQAVLSFVAKNGLYDMVSVSAITERYYPFGSLAAHLLGFVGSDGQGLYGIELQYDSVLRGEDGSYITARDSTGNELPDQYEAYVAATDGSTLHLTIDAYVQAQLEAQLEAARVESAADNRVCGIVMDVESGAILAMATAPAFDPNTPFSLNAASAEKLSALHLEEGSAEFVAAKNNLLLETWSNKAITEIYMPGSTFKTLTCSAVLEEKAVIDLEERFFCSGSLRVADRVIHCHKVGGHGSLTFREGLQNSCNPVMMTIAARLGTDTFYEYVKAFGMLEKTGIDLPGEGGSIFHAKNSFTELDLATASFGQNFKVSVLQMITAVSAVANGGSLMTPFVVERITAPDGTETYCHEAAERRCAVSRETANTVSEILAGGVAGEGGAKNAYVAGYRVAAKTGTSEKIGDDPNARIGSCVGFAPADDPEIAAIIVVDEPTDGSRYGSVVAAPYVAGVFAGVLPYLDVERRFTEEEEKNRTVTVPDCSGWSPSKATEILSEAGLSFSFVGEGDTVTAQLPAAGSAVLLAGASVTLTLGEGSIGERPVPDVVGMSATEANRTLVNAGFNVSVMGAADVMIADKTVIEQLPSAGTPLAAGSVVTIRFLFEESRE